MISQLENLIISSIELFLAAAFFHKVIPTVLDRHGYVPAFESWCVACTLTMFGTGRLIHFIYALDTHWTFAIGHISLCILALSYYFRKTADGIVTWDRSTRSYPFNENGNAR